MPRKKADAVDLTAVEPEAVDVSVDEEAVRLAPDVEIVYVDAEPEPVAIPADEQVARFTLDNPPARLAALPRHIQKPIIQRANGYIQQGMTAHEALTLALS